MYQRARKEVFHDLVTFVSVKPIKKMARGVEKPGIEIAYKIGDGSNHKGAPWTKNAFADSLKNCKNVLTSLREGDAITLELTVNGQYKNLAGVIAGHVENPNRIPMKGATSSGGTTPSFGVKKSGGTDYNERAAKGQALNLAFNVAIAQGKFDDDAYILSLIPRMLKLGEAAQNGSTQLPATDSIVTALGQTETVQATTPTNAAPQAATQSSAAQGSTIQQGELDSTLDDLFGGI